MTANIFLSWPRSTVFESIPNAIIRICEANYGEFGNIFICPCKIFFFVYFFNSVMNIKERTLKTIWQMHGRNQLEIDSGMIGTTVISVMNPTNSAQYARHKILSTKYFLLSDI